MNIQTKRMKQEQMKINKILQIQILNRFRDTKRKSSQQIINQNYQQKQSQTQPMQHQYPENLNYTNQNSYQQSNSINEDLIKLRQMNQAFTKMNQDYMLYEGYEYYQYEPQAIEEMESFNVKEVYSVQQSLENKQGQDITERSNSLLFTLSEKDEEETRPTTNIQQLQYEYDINGNMYQVDQNNNNMNSNRFGSYQYQQSMTVNNTLSNNIFYDEQENSGMVQNSDPYPQERQVYDYNNSNNGGDNYHPEQYQNPYQQQHNPNNYYARKSHQHSTASNGFSKYQEFAVKISKLFNIHVEDLEVIYNQLKFEKQAECQGINERNADVASHVQISDSEVMKKLFSYALEIKNSHNKLKNMITTIDDRKNHKIHYNNQSNTTVRHNNHRERPQTHIPQKTQLQNISINFMLQQQHHPINHPQYSIQSHNKKADQTQRISHKKPNHQESENIQSKKTIIQKLVGQKGNLNSQLVSQQTIMSHSSYADSNLTNTKTNKSKKKSRVTEKIKLISEQLESLKKEIDQEEEGEVNGNGEDKKQQPNLSNFYSQREQTSQRINQEHQNNGPTFSFEQDNTPAHEYLPKMTRQISQYVIQVNQSQSKSPAVVASKIQYQKQSQPHTFGGESFTYIKSIEQLPMDDPEIDLKIQQTIKTCIVKSPSKKLISQPNHQQSGQIHHVKQPIASQEKKSQKLIVEQGQTASSRSKYSFKQNSQVSTKDNNQTMITSPTKSQSRQKMFKSIAEMRKHNNSKDKQNQSSQSQWSMSKTTNNAYLDDQNNSEDKNQSGLFTKNVFESNTQGSHEKIATNFAKPKFFTKQVMRDGKLVFEKSQVVQSQHKIRSPNDQRKQTATFGALSPEQTEKFIKANQTTQQNPIFHINNISANLHSSHSPIVYHSNISQPQAGALNSQPVSNTLLQRHEANRKPLSLGVPSSLYSARTIESRPFIESENHLPRPSSKAPVYVMHQQYPQNNMMQKQKYEYVPKMINVSPNLNNISSNVILTQSPQIRNEIPGPQIVQVVRPVTPQKQHQVYRPVTPINKIQNINFQVAINKEKPRSFSVQRVQKGQNFNESKNFHILNTNIAQRPSIGNNVSHIKISPSGPQHHIVSRPVIMNTPVSERKIVQRPFSVPIRSITPERNIPVNFKQTLIQKPKVIQNNYTLTNIPSVIRKQEPQMPVIARQFELKPPSENRVKQIVLPQKQYQQKPAQVVHNVQQSRSMVQQSRKIQSSQKGQVNPILNQSKHPNKTFTHDQNSQLNNGSRHTNLQIDNFPDPNSNKNPDIPPNQLTHIYSQPQLRNPRLQQSEMYYGELKESIRTPNTQIPTNYKQMNLMSSRKTDSVVHTFPVQMEQSNKMNNSIYTKDQGANHITERMNNVNSKPTYGQIITYQPPTSPKNPFSPQPSRIPNSFRPPKYIPPKQQSSIQSNQNNNMSKPTQYPLMQQSRPPIKTYTMGHLLQASRTQKYMQESIMDDRKSNTALNASNVNVRLNELHDSTPSFGRVQEENGAQSLVISPFSKELNNLNQSRNSSASKRSSSSRSKSNRKGITLESKRSRSPSHKFFQSSYDHLKSYK